MKYVIKKSEGVQVPAPCKALLPRQASNLTPRTVRPP